MSRKMKLIGVTGSLLVLVIAISTVGIVFSEEYTGPKATKQDLDELRKLMKSNSIHAYIIPSNDAHQSEYIAPSDARLAFISGFTGSAGYGIVTLDDAALWTDSRYHLQAERQVDQSLWTIMKMGNVGVLTRAEWLLAALGKNSKVGFDPVLVSSTEIATLTPTMTQNNHSMVPLEKNLIDSVWKNKPQPNLTPLKPHSLEYSGRNSSSKIQSIRDELKKNQAEAIFLTALDDIAWLFNLRATDVKNTPVFYSYALVSDKIVQLYLHKNRFTKLIEDHFKAEGVKDTQIKDYLTVAKDFSTYVNSTKGRIYIPTAVNHAIYSAVPASRLVQKNLVAIMKSVKNEIEAEGMKKCHVRDGAAIVQYLHWLEENVGTRKITEMDGAVILGEFRARFEKFQSLSFTAISAVGSNAAMAHYTPSNESAKEITRNEVYLIDSGGQYLDGTTDTTRTIHLGTPSAFEKEAFTRVLKGFIAVYTSIFPSGATETYFDAVARRSLWEVGLDYGHGTGHGIGSFLAVHEYPPLFSSRPDPAFPGLIKNMFVSNEPGVYIDGKFGVRIEDVVQVVPINTQFDFNGRGSMKYDIVTMVPFQTSLMDLSLLTEEEVAWINSYHAKTLREVGDLLLKVNDVSSYNWLKEATKPIQKLTK
ncbi:xaa-Pro aminopeptidase ApepP-like [Culicoides brevitarsis]|uniref:xaa-Pro aminopeptidase ApepP-like n=1 Tax=Culicoides brevitarsis TaxID=469753 RepID=UPI00307C4751